MSDVRPSGGYDDGAARLLASARARLHAVAADFALPAGYRLTEWQRATLSTLVSALVRDVEDELRAAVLEDPASDRLGDGLRAALGSAGLAIALPLIEGGRLLAQPQFLSLLLRRAEEQRLSAGAAEHSLLGALAGDEDAAVAAEAMALLAAQSSRFDAFQEPLVGRFDLSADLRHQLFWTVAAAIRRYAIERHGADPAQVDEAIAHAAAAVLPRYDEAAGVEPRAMRLAALLAQRGRLDDEVAARAAGEGNLPLLLATLAVRAALPFEGVWDLVSDGAGAGAPLVLRAASIGRVAAAAILFRIAPSDAAAAGQLDRYDAQSEAEIVRLLGPWQVDPAYRDAIAELAQ